LPKLLLQPWLCPDFRGKLSPLAGIQWTTSQQAMKGKEQRRVLRNGKKKNGKKENKRRVRDETMSILDHPLQTVVQC